MLFVLFPEFDNARFISSQKTPPCLNVDFTVQFISLSPKDTRKLHANLTFIYI